MDGKVYNKMSTRKRSYEEKELSQFEGFSKQFSHNQE